MNMAQSSATEGHTSTGSSGPMERGQKVKHMNRTNMEKCERMNKTELLGVIEELKADLKEVARENDVIREERRIVEDQLFKDRKDSARRQKEHRDMIKLIVEANNLDALQVAVDNAMNLAGFVNDKPKARLVGYVNNLYRKSGERTWSNTLKGALSDLVWANDHDSIKYALQEAISLLRSSATDIPDDEWDPGLWQYVNTLNNNYTGCIKSLLEIEGKFQAMSQDYEKKIVDLNGQLVEASRMISKVQTAYEEYKSNAKRRIEKLEDDQGSLIESLAESQQEE